VYLSAFNRADTETILRAVDQHRGETEKWCRFLLRNKRKRFFGFGIAAGRKSDDEFQTVNARIILGNWWLQINADWKSTVLTFCGMWRRDTRSGT
jgi:hypothetical protein